MEWRGSPAFASLLASQGIPVVTVSYRLGSDSLIGILTKALVPSIIIGIILWILEVVAMLIINYIGIAAGNYVFGRNVAKWGSWYGFSLAGTILGLYALAVFVALCIKLVSTTYQHPTQAEDVAAACHWVTHNLHKVNPRLRARGLILSGHSAGAHLVSYVATNPAMRRRSGLTLRGIEGIYKALAGVQAGAETSPRLVSAQDVHVGLGDGQGDDQGLVPLVGVLSLSGIYNLPAISSKWWFDLGFKVAYSFGVFGYSGARHLEASPLQQLAWADRRWEAMRHRQEKPGTGAGAGAGVGGEGGDDKSEDALYTPMFLVYNAESDLNLQADGHRFASRLVASAAERVRDIKARQHQGHSSKNDSNSEIDTHAEDNRFPVVSVPAEIVSAELGVPPLAQYLWVPGHSHVTIITRIAAHAGGEKTIETVRQMWNAWRKYGGVEEPNKSL
jgi:uncharacterized membrane protein